MFQVKKQRPACYPIRALARLFHGLKLVGSVIFLCITMLGNIDPMTVASIIEKHLFDSPHPVPRLWHPASLYLLHPWSRLSEGERTRC